MHETSLLSTPDQFGPVLLPYLNKNDDEELCFLKYFGFSNYKHFLHINCNLVLMAIPTKQVRNILMQNFA